MSMVEINAGTIHFEEFGPKDGRPVVFVHGYLMGGDLWRQVGTRLAARGLRCIAPTCPLGVHPSRCGRAPTAASRVSRPSSPIPLPHWIFKTWCWSVTTPAG